MTVAFTKPLLMLDVDGVLNPWQLATPNGHTAGAGFTKYLLPADEAEEAAGLATMPVLLSSVHGEMLRALSESFDLVWATTWEDMANRHISPLLGLPTDLPVVHWPDEDTRRAEWRAGHGNRAWKTRFLVEWLDEHAPGRPWAWVDDEVTRYDRTWVKQHYLVHPAAPYLVVRVNRKTTLTQAECTRLREWAKSLG